LVFGYGSHANVLGCYAPGGLHAIMPRWLFNVVAAVSLALCAVALLLWARSVWGPVDKAYVHLPGERFVELSSNGSALGAAFYGGEDWTTRTFDPRATRDWQWMGFRYHRVRGGRDYDTVVRDELGAFIPSWFAVAVTAVAPIVVAVRMLRGRRRRGSGRCPGCGYDLRATPDRCPECGTAQSVTLGRDAQAT
jgi:hypothetical protein